MSVEKIKRSFKFSEMKDLFLPVGIWRYLYSPISFLYCFAFTGIFLYFTGALSGECISGGDWSLPCSGDQLSGFMANALSTWSFGTNINGGYTISNLASLSITSLIYFFAKIFGFAYYLAAFIFLLVGAIYYGLSLLITELGLDKRITLVALPLILLSPAFQNYFLMGWLGVLLLLAFIPLYIVFFLRYVSTGKLIDLLVGSLLFALCVFQSQGVFFLTAALIGAIFFAIKERKFLLTFKFFAANVIAFVLLNFHWLLPTILHAPTESFGGKSLLFSEVSLGADSKLSFFNLILGKFGLFNQQVELILENSNLDFVFPILLIIALFGLYRSPPKAQIVLGGILLLIPVTVFFNENRHLLELIPYGHSLRHLGRSSILFTFANAILIAVGLVRIAQIISLRVGKFSYFLYILLGAIPAVYAYPLLSFELQNWMAQKGPDFRLRHFDNSETTGYWKIDKRIWENKNYKTLLLPLGGFLKVSDDRRFNVNGFSTLVDRDGKYSFPAGSIEFSDKSKPMNSWYDYLQGLPEFDKKTLKLKLSKSDIRYIVFRKKFYGANDYIFIYLKKMLDENLLKKLDSNPHFDLLLNPYAKSSLDIQSNDCGQTDLKIFRLTFTIFSAFTSLNQNIKGSCVLNVKLNDQRSSGWRLHQVKNSFNDDFQKFSPFSLHKSFGAFRSFSPLENLRVEFSNLYMWALNRYQSVLIPSDKKKPNEWSVPCNESCKRGDTALLLEFFPQRYFIIGLLISLASMSFILMLILAHFVLSVSQKYRNV